MTEEQIVKVDLADRSYDIIIGRELLRKTGEYINSLGLLPQVFIITDDNVSLLHLNALLGSLKESGVEYVSIAKPAGEKSKSFKVWKEVMEAILAHKPERGITLIALGGGVIGDLTGFVASTLLRGVNFIQIPTTLLAMVDSSVGGKTGINSRHGKNLVGSFYQPRLVLADIDLLATLPEREFLAGYAEIVKYGLINDEEFFADLEGGNVCFNGNKKALVKAVKKSCEAKAAIVSADEREKGARALLNLGHTFAHALEVESGYSKLLLHGEAVAIGMVLAFKLSEEMGYCPAADVKRVVKHLKDAGLPTSIKDIANNMDSETILRHMYGDKKVEGGKLVLVLARGIGQAFIEKDVPPEKVLKILGDDLK